MLARPNGGWEPLIARAAGDRVSGGPWVATCARYLDELLAWNQRTDLTAARTVEELVDLTVADAAVVAAASPDIGGWTDVGSGAGAPGLILAMLLPEARVTLVEPRDRRVAFLRSAIGKFGLANTTVVRGRSDQLPEHTADVAVSRATLPPREWLQEGARLAKSGVWVLLAREEAPQQAGLVQKHDIRYEWPLTQVPRRAVRYARE
ncbi:MAG TPA: RsmG family class I SAM-dependent methyltransferase [Polyangiaceae bacterium]|jgi:16S rRNA (guanine527-N7)-methyltransferase|nr:RsmG family class I SAM-dependent methyltransferase [Polyangiaceae bacterium]